MFTLRNFIVVAAAFAAVSASPVEDIDNCQNHLGDCFGNGCNGVFGNPNDTTGTCTAGTYNGCPCEKCGSDSGYTGACDANGCAGVTGICSAGQYQGCPCT